MLQDTHENEPKGKLSNVNRSATHFDTRLAYTALGTNGVRLIDLSGLSQDKFEQSSKNCP